jgi:transposase
VENTSEGHAVLLAWLRRHRVKRVGIEASGGYEQPVVAAMRGSSPRMTSGAPI